MIQSNLLMNKQSVLINLTCHLSFATDAECRKAILDRFAMAECTWQDINLQAARLQARADMIADEIEQLYKTTLYEYNPIENYDRYEESSDDDSRSSSASSHDSGNNRTYQYPFDKEASRPVTSGTNEGDASSSVSDTEHRAHTAHLHGNIGVTTSQQMIQSERDIILNMLQVYADRFRDLFMFTI